MTAERLRRLLSGVLVLITLGVCAAAQAQVFKVPTREGVTTSLFWQAVPDARGTVLLFPGGGGGFGRIEAGQPTSQNFLVRSRSHFEEAGFNVAIFGKPDDMAELDYADRISAAHVADMAAVVAFIKDKSAAPLWLVGTSRGTISAASALIQSPAVAAATAGLVLTSSIVNERKTGALPRQDLGQIRVPVLVVHHRDDACNQCRPAEVPSMFRGLRHAPVKKLMLVSGGAEPAGDPCGALHRHGFIGIEREVVESVAGWINKPVD